MEMKWYISRRVLWAIVATFIILTFTFGLLMVSPNPEASAAAFTAAQEGGDPEEARERIEQIRGEDRPVHEQYLDFMTSMATFDWGSSFTYSEPVRDTIIRAYPYSLAVVVPPTIFAIISGFAIGVYSSTHQYSKGDFLGTAFAFFGLSLPNFWFAIMLMLVFAVSLGWLPVSYDTTVDFWSLEHIRYLILPWFVLWTGAIASEMRYARAETLEYVQAAWTKTARAKGLDETKLTYRHIFRPAMVPLITIVIGDLVGIIFATALVVEVIFAIPGLGLISYQALVRQDTPLVLVTIMIPVFIAIIGNLLQDIAYTILDPRISYEGREG